MVTSSQTTGIIDFLWSWPTGLFCLGIYFLTFSVRRVLEHFFPHWVHSSIWRDVWLPTLPPIVGISVALLTRKYPFPPEISSMSARVFFGAVAGGVSAWAYKVIKGVLRKQWGVELPDDDAATQPDMPIPVHVQPPEEVGGEATANEGPKEQ